MEYTKTFPTLMSGKKILYVHGFGSSGQSGTVTRIRTLLPEATVIAPDLPIHPAEAMQLLRETCDTEKPDLIIGTSMGGMYAEMLYGYDRILTNPAFQIGETISKNNMLGKVTFSNPRKDGIMEFMMTKQLQEEYRETAAQCFSGVTDDEQRRIYGIFGLEDPLVHTFDLFAAHYRQALHFHGEHRLNDSILIHSVIPIVRWIDDRQNGRERSILYISIEDTMERNGKPMESLLKCYRYLIEYYDVYVVAANPSNSPDYARRMHEFAFETLGVAAHDRLILTNQKNLLYGDYLIDSHTDLGASNFMGTRIDFGSDTFKTWDEVLEYYERLGGQ